MKKYICTRWHVLMYLKEYGKSTAYKISKFFHKPKINIQRSLRRLKEDSYVDYEEVFTSQKTKRWSITRRGRERLKELKNLDWTNWHVYQNLKKKFPDGVEIPENIRVNWDSEVSCPRIDRQNNLPRGRPEKEEVHTPMKKEQKEEYFLYK